MPDSNALPDDSDLASQRSMIALAQRLQGAAAGGTPTGLHGTGIVSTVVLPSGDQLSTSSENVVEATQDLAFRVTIQNTGEHQVGIKITLTIQKTPEPIVKTATIDLINPNEQKSCGRRDPVTPFGPTTPVKVDVSPVPGESRTTNNSSEYPVVFSCRSGARGRALEHRRSRDRDRGGGRRARFARVRALRLGDASPSAACAGRAARRRQGGPRRLRGLAPGADRRPAPGRRRGRRRPLARRRRVDDCVAKTSIVATTPRGQGGAVVGDVRAARLGAHRRRRERDPGSRLRADLHEGARPRPSLDALSPEELEAIERAMAH